MINEWINALIGGILIGTSVSLMLLWNGRVTGISGIVYGLLNPQKGDMQWRILFVVGLVFGGWIIGSQNEAAFQNTVESSDLSLAVAGLLVGFGSVLGSGCTSGHGVCGLSRVSIRSIVATLTFMSAGILAVALFRSLGVIQ